MCACATVRPFLFACVACCLLLLLHSSQARPASSYAEGTPALKREKRSASSRGCVKVALSPDLIKALSINNAPRIPLQEREERGWSHFVQVGDEERAGGEDEGEATAEREPRACRGRVVESESLAFLVQEPSANVWYILFSEQPSLSHLTTVWFECSGHQQCFQLLPGEGSPKSRVRRNQARTTHTSPHTSNEKPEEDENISSLLAGVGVAIVGLVGVMALLAMCAHGSQTYEPDLPDSRVSDEVAAVVSENPATKSESMVNLLNEGSSSTEQPPEGKSITASLAESQQSGSQDPLVQSGNETAVAEVRGKDLARLNGPTLEVAEMPAKDVSEKSEKKEEEEEGPYSLVNEPEPREYDYVENTDGDMSKEEDEAGYAYATVGQGAAQPLAKPEGGGADDRVMAGEGRDDKGAGLPPYGKVTRHLVPVSKKGEYSEVVPSSPILPPGRPRAVTEPIDPSSVAAATSQQPHTLRDDRGFTESAAHLPLPQIPQLDVNDEPYDSIPDDMRSDGTSDGAAAEGKPVRESLYEEVTVEADIEGGDEDMYESVPEDIRHDVPPMSPDNMSPSSPFPPQPPSPLMPRAKPTAEGATPSSPTSKEKDDEDKKKKGKDAAKDGKGDHHKKQHHKVLNKAKSDTGESRGRSLSSLFTRKKGANTPASPKLKILPGPLTHVPASSGNISSPTHLPHSPPLIPAPPPPSEEDVPQDAGYDVIDVLNPRGAALLKNASTAKSKSASLPSTMRGSGGGSPFHVIDHGPLPQLPEESEGGLVARQRMKEEMDPEYDTVVLGQVRDDPNYDSVEVARDPDAMPKLEPAEPIGEDRQQQEPEDRGGLTPGNRYARVSSHAGVEGATSPDNSGLAPEHDELGYAVIPAHLKMRKRAMSDAVKKRSGNAEGGGRVATARPKSAEIVDDPGYDKITGLQLPSAEGETATEGGPDQEKDPPYESVTDALREAEATEDKKEEPYATVDMAAKRRSQYLKQLSAGAAGLVHGSDGDLRENSPSPKPPPLPQQGDLGDLAEFEQPPIPLQAEEALQLIDPSELQPPTKSPNPYSQIDVLNDPPYASVKKKTPTDSANKEDAQTANNYEDENPYATVDNDGEGGEALSTVPSDPPYARIKEGRVVEESASVTETSRQVESSGGVEPAQNGMEQLDGGQDENDDGTYDRLDHGFGNAATCRANAGTAATSLRVGGERESTTITVDFSASPELVITQPEGTDTEVNGVLTHMEEKIINFS